MTVVEIINAVVVAVGVPSIVVALIFIGKKLQMLDVLEQTTERIKNNVKVIADALIYSDIPFNSGKLQTYSPISITKVGRRYLEDVGFLRAYDEHSSDFVNCIKSEEPRTKYDVEIAAEKSVMELFCREYFREVKTYLYHHRKQSRREFMKVAGIYVRDRYLDDHAEIRDL